MSYKTLSTGRPLVAFSLLVLVGSVGGVADTWAQSTPSSPSPAPAAIGTNNDFNSSRSNRECCQLSTATPAGGTAASPATSPAPAVSAMGTVTDFNSTRSNRERGQLTGVSPTSGTQQPAATAAAAPDNDFNSSRSNRTRQLVLPVRMFTNGKNEQQDASKSQ
jgi:hypothetical protein